MRKIIIDKDVKIEGITNRFPLNSLVAEVYQKKVCLRDKQGLKKELLEDFNNITDSNGYLFGNSIEDVIETLNNEFKLSNIKNFTVNSLSTLETNISFLDFNNAFVLTPIVGNKINSIGTIDNDNSSNQDASLINQNFTDLVYNNTSAGSSNKSLPGIDLGIPKEIGIISLYWWSNSFIATNFKIQGSNNGTNWIDIKTNITALNLGTERQDVSVNSTFRYFRVFCVTGNNPTWCVLSEMEAYSKGTYKSVSASSNNELQFWEKNEKLIITNLSNNNLDLKVIIK